ncbi:inverted formin-2-like [Daktulosphaira vitifoliae]|uniref:inverted formin-2-like n=1 Tax=Daktulosphaira vitifoliae TaxID=58002 RepID=UPI0021AAD33A|nr:inverted formin-2-like [Daktulosphaira vitifoliae]
MLAEINVLRSNNVSKLSIKKLPQISVIDNENSCELSDKQLCTSSGSRTSLPLSKFNSTLLQPSPSLQPFIVTSPPPPPLPSQSTICNKSSPPLLPVSIPLPPPPPPPPQPLPIPIPLPPPLPLMRPETAPSLLKKVKMKTINWTKVKRFVFILVVSEVLNRDNKKARRSNNVSKLSIKKLPQISVIDNENSCELSDKQLCTSSGSRTSLPLSKFNSTLLQPSPSLQPFIVTSPPPPPLPSQSTICNKSSPPLLPVSIPLPPPPPPPPQPLPIPIPLPPPLPLMRPETAPSLLKKVKMKTINWTKVKSNNLENSFWSTLDPVDCAIDSNNIIELFGEKQRPQTTPSTNKNNTLKPSSEPIVFLKNFEDGNVISVDKLEIVKRILPINDDVKLIKKYGGDRTVLGIAEKFCLMLSEIPYYELKIDLMVLEEEWPLMYSKVLDNLKGYQEICCFLVAEHSLTQFFSIILLLGNKLNAEISFVK